MAVATSTAIALALAAAAAGTSYYNTQQTTKKQNAAAIESIRNQRGIQDEANAKVQRVLADVEASSPAGERQKAADAYLQQVRNAQQVARQGLSQRGLSDEYDEGAAQAGDQAQDYATMIGGLMSRIDAPTNQRTREGFTFGNLSTDVGLTQAKSRGQQWVDALKMKGIRRNPWLDAAAAAMNGASSYAGASTGSGGATADNWSGLTGAGLAGGYGSTGGYNGLFGP